MADKVPGTSEEIARLASQDPRQREEAARNLFRLGCAAAEPALQRWLADREFRSLVRSTGPLLTVGIAVEPTRFAEIRSRFGEPRLAEVPPDQDAIEFEVNFAHGMRLDILTTRDSAGGGAIAGFLARFGEGIQQIECEVRDVARATQLLRSRFGLEPIYPEAYPGAGGTHVNFFLTPTMESRKVLIELVEVPITKKQKERKETL